MQLLNVAHGGTLHQHLREVTGHDGHRPPAGDFTLGRLPLKLLAGSRIADVLDEDEPHTACHHHQAVDRTGAGLTVTATAQDGTVEALEVTGHPLPSVCNGNAGTRPTNDCTTPSPGPPDA